MPSLSAWARRFGLERLEAAATALVQAPRAGRSFDDYEFAEKLRGEFRDEFTRARTRLRRRRG
eukprot:3430119-Alexandrium_andersonii.AAC.1